MNGKKDVKGSKFNVRLRVGLGHMANYYDIQIMGLKMLMIGGDGYLANSFLQFHITYHYVKL